MSEIFKKLSAMIISFILMIVFNLQGFALNNTAKAQRFNEDSSFRIMHITDTHLEYLNLDKSVWLIEEACVREQPDLIALTGDIAMSDDKEEMLTCIDRLMNIFEEYQIPVAVTFGNHDIETPHFNGEELMKIYNSYDCSISIDEGDELTGCGTYNVPILSSKGDDIKYNLWFFDSGSSDGEGHYSNVPADQVEWYKEKSEELEKECSKKIDALAFQHIIVPEIYDALDKRSYKIPYAYEHLYNKGEYYYFNQSLENHGLFHETPCPGYYNHGQFEAMVNRGDVHGIFSGHDHTNAFSVKYKNINITNSLSTRYNSDMFSTQYGYRIIDINENDTGTYTTRVVHWYDFFELNDAFELYENGDKFGGDLALEICFKGFFQKYGQLLGIKLTELFTGRQVNYQ